MILKTLVQAVFCIQVIRISATGRDEAQEEARMIINSLKKLKDDESVPFSNILQKSQNNYPHYMNGLNKGMNSDMFQALYNNAHTYKNIANMKPKRGWEDVSLIWRKSPKRAWEFINKLWKDPVIRRKYKTYLENGKRSDELMENIPVQQNNVNPFWVTDEIGYDDIDLDHPIVRNGAGDNALWLAKSSKRGWEIVNPGDWKNIRSNIADIGKRGWEELNWKRAVGGPIRNNLVPRNGEFGDTSMFDLNVIKALHENTGVNQLTKFRPVMQPTYLSSGKDTELIKKMKSNISLMDDENDIFSKNILGNLSPNNIQKYNEEHDGTHKVERGYDMSKRSAFENLCRMLVGDLTKCRDVPYFV
ncbi:uncharacterized protein LOC123562895 [Mercenaria mercenaria]|uniref:uncharacterized protein LOC123562895 n=1 Tax=Mercenaria mercenaria TaxID=6596 RepID=UPI00234F2A05|nr:uncharacterized protein LOC123562895 [Mercenaria mercenaria]